ncbi:hypothetical protein EVAR_2480_1 [Eumeta japonica]|uniref:Uncharacterized protein n=1 Tax=Eumeta variegata TaxID=151549 RepID=A0A4C1SPB5_EUMVA|nr:hypothetical protein EVAR_2480_1 [Eumeta japonica]
MVLGVSKQLGLGVNVDYMKSEWLGNGHPPLNVTITPGDSGNSDPVTSRGHSHPGPARRGRNGPVNLCSEPGRDSVKSGGGQRAVAVRSAARDWHLTKQRIRPHSYCGRSMKTQKSRLKALDDLISNHLKFSNLRSVHSTTNNSSGFYGSKKFLSECGSFRSLTFIREERSPAAAGGGGEHAPLAGG